MKNKIPAKIKNNVRFVAVDILMKITTEQGYSNLLINDAINKTQLPSKDAKLLTELVYGVTSRRLLLQFYLSPFIANAKKVDPWVAQLLLLSIYQLFFLDRVPAHAILNDAVEIAKVKGNSGIGKFVNGVLRSIQRKGKPDTASISDQIARLSIEISMPRWLVEKLLETMSLQEVRNLGESLFKPSHVSARVNLLKLDREQAISRLEAEGFEVRKSKISPVGIIGEKGFLAGSTLFKKGELTIQDESSMLVAPALQIEPQHYVLDACAAPGGKTTHIATYLDPEKGGRVVALDIHQHKLALIQQNAERLQVANVVETKLLDAREVKQAFPEAIFDRILVDAPCSGLGLLRRKPDIKYSKTNDDFKKLQKIQLEILESVSTSLKFWGIMTYSTCTFTEEENEDVIQQFLAKHPDFEKIPVAGSETVQQSVNHQSVKIYPNQYETDGFFISCLQRKSK